MVIISVFQTDDAGSIPATRSRSRSDWSMAVPERKRTAKLPAPDREANFMHFANTIIIILWLAFLAYWLFSAFGVKKTASGGSPKTAMIRILAILAIILILQIQSIRNVLGWSTAAAASSWLSAIAVLFTAAGIS